MQGWLERVGRKNPGKALSIMGVLAEFIVPKLARTEHTGADGGPMKLQTSIEFVDAAAQSGAVPS